MDEMGHGRAVSAKQFPFSRNFHRICARRVHRSHVQAYIRKQDLCMINDVPSRCLLSPHGGRLDGTSVRDRQWSVP